MDRVERADRCMKILEGLYGTTRAEKINPVGLLIITILSQNTTDVNSLKAYGRLKTAYPEPEDVLAAPEEEVARLIKVGGLAGIKAKRIRDALRIIKERAGTITLDFLKDMDLEEARDYLMSIPGVGPKTAAVVLLFAFGRPTMPVDTHVHRLSRRIGLAPENASPEEARKALERVVPVDKYLSFHVNLIRHGRKVCKARGPLHDQCDLRPICECYLRAQSLNESTT